MTNIEKRNITNLMNKISDERRYHYDMADALEDRRLQPERDKQTEIKITYHRNEGNILTERLDTIGIMLGAIGYTVYVGEDHKWHIMRRTVNDD